jgi:hypothetical protein
LLLGEACLIHVSHCAASARADQRWAVCVRFVTDRGVRPLLLGLR